MLVSEAEARTKWCPFARVPYSTGTSFNCAAGPDPEAQNVTGWPLNARCIASDCMAWRPAENDPVWQLDTNIDPPPRGAGAAWPGDRRPQ